MEVHGELQHGGQISNFITIIFKSYELSCTLIGLTCKLGKVKTLKVIFNRGDAEIPLMQHFVVLSSSNGLFVVGNSKSSINSKQIAFTNLLSQNPLVLHFKLQT